MNRLPPSAAIRHHAARGMARDILARIYGADPVARVLGEDGVRLVSSAKPDPRALPFGKQLQAAREAQGHTQNICAKLILSPQATTSEIAGYEAGDKQLRDKRRIKRIADYIGVSVKDLMPAIVAHNEAIQRARRIDKPPTVVEMAAKRTALKNRKPAPKRSRLDLTDAALDEAVAMWRAGLTVAEMSRATGVPAHIYHRAIQRIRATVEAGA